MTAELYETFLQIVSAAWLAFVVGVWFSKRHHPVDRYLAAGWILACPYLLTCYGIRSVQVAEDIEAIAQIHRASPVSVEPLATMASFSISTKGGNHVQFDESGGWSVYQSGGGDYGLSDGGPRSMPAILGRSRRELPAAGFTAPENAAAGREPLSMPATDGTAGSGSWWRSQGCDGITDSDCRDGRVVEQINQPAEGIEPRREN